MTLILITLFTSLALANPEKDNIKKVHIDFEGYEITGQLIKPNYIDISVRKHRTFTPLIRPKRHFRPEISKTADDI